MIQMAEMRKKKNTRKFLFFLLEYISCFESDWIGLDWIGLNCIE